MPYYDRYEQRYQAVHAIGARWGHAAEDPDLIAALTAWVEANGLRGKRVLEFACGEGVSGAILARLGCAYHGVDLSPSAVSCAREFLKDMPNATVSRLDMVREPVSGVYDAALDVMGLHMLVTDADRAAYLRNAWACLAPGGPMLFFRETRAEAEAPEAITSVEQWAAHTGMDYETPETRTAAGRDGAVELRLPRLPARGRSEAGYRREMTDAGFIVDGIQPSAGFGLTIFVHRPAGGKEHAF